MKPLPSGTSGYVAGVALVCSDCKQPVVWRQGEGFCHVGQYNGALCVCGNCGYSGDMSPEQLSAGCPTCKSKNTRIDHYADLRADDLRKLQAAGWDV